MRLEALTAVPSSLGDRVRAMTQPYITLAFALLGVSVFGCLFLGARGFAPVVGIAGVILLPYARISRADWPGIGLLAALILWSALTIIWTPAPNLHVFTAKGLTRLTVLHMAMQLGLCLSFVTAAARLDAAHAKRSLTYLAAGLLAVQALLIEESLSHATVYRAVLAMAHYPPLRLDMTIRAFTQSGHVSAVLAWPLGLGLYRLGRPRAALALALFPPVLLLLLRGFAPTAGLLVSLPVFFLVKTYGRKAVMGLMAVTVAYMLLTPLAMMAVAHFGLYQTYGGHLPPSWSDRLRIWSFVADQLQHSPLRGAGLDASRVFAEVVPLHPHNNPLQLWFELGLPGALLGTAFWAWLLRRIADRSETGRLFAAGASATLTVYMVIGAVGFGLWQEWWLCVGALGMAACVVMGKFVDPPRAAA